MSRSSVEGASRLSEIFDRKGEQGPSQLTENLPGKVNKANKRYLFLFIVPFICLFPSFSIEAYSLNSKMHPKNEGEIDIFIKSYRNDFKWLYYTLKSIEKYVQNVHKIVVVIPKNDIRLFNIKTEKNCKLHFVKEKGNGYLFQQYVKLTAHHFSSADYIMYVDSDCVFTKQIDLLSLIKNGKPRILMTKYADLVDANGKSLVPWKQPTEKAMGRNVEYEFMRRNFIIYKRSTLANFEKWFPHDLKEYILSQDIFSEFNVIGAFAYFFEYDEYEFVDTTINQIEEPVGKQYWSLSNMTPREKEELESIIR